MRNLSISQFEKELSSLTENFRDKKYLLAVSGGVDSMVLAQVFYDAKLDFEVAHVNYHLREEASNLDEDLVRDFCLKKQIPFNLYEVETSDERPKYSVQLWARKLRYAFFKRILEQNNLDFLVTAHHLNDQLETLLINLSRGSGIKGIAGIPPNENEILRPFLGLTKEEIYDYAREMKIEFREDESNQKTVYQRNKIRHEVVPNLLEMQPNFWWNFKKSMKYLHQTKGFVEMQINTIFEQILIDENEEEIILDKEILEVQSDFVKFEILQRFGFDDAKEINKIFLAETGKSFFSKMFQLTVNREEIIITENKEHFESFEEFILVEDEEDLQLKNHFVDVSNELEMEQKNNEEITWEINTEKLQFPLRIRHRRQGDFFYPVGMFGKKKVSKYFKDEKLSVLAKQKIWLLCDGNDDVLGIIPMRQDRRFVGNKKNGSTLTIKL